jgi:golgi apparatus protein 1
LQGGSQVYECLRDNRPKLTGLCQATLFDHELHMVTSIDFIPPAKWFCAAEISQHCKRTDRWGSGVMRCLREKQFEATFSRHCLAV